MRLDDLLAHKAEWLKGIGPNSEIIISSRIRLARNLAHQPFSHRAKKPGQDEVLQTLTEALAQCHPLKGALFLKLEALDEVDKGGDLCIVATQAGGRCRLVQDIASDPPKIGPKPAHL